MTDTLNKVDNFIRSLELPEFSEVLFDSFEDCSYFYSHYYRRSISTTIDLMKYREYKIKNTNISLENFLDMCKHDFNVAFQLNFLEIFSNEDLIQIEEAIHHGRITLSVLYALFHRDVNVTIMRHIKMSMDRIITI